jgi:hypothetical protein
VQLALIAGLALGAPLVACGSNAPNEVEAQAPTTSGEPIEPTTASSKPPSEGQLVVNWVPDAYYFDHELRPNTERSNTVILQFFPEREGRRPTPAGNVGRGRIVVNAATVPNLADRDVATLAGPGDEWKLVARTAVDGKPSAVFEGTTGPVMSHMVVFTLDIWRLQVISDVASVEELLAVASSVQVR